MELHDFSLRYLAPYRDVLKAQTAQLNLDEAWVYGLIRQESRFIANAKSHAGRERPHAAHAGDGAMGGEEAQAEGLALGAA